MDEWISASNLPEIRNHEVHVWRGELRWTDPQIIALKRFLSKDEIARAEAFFYPELTSRFIAARAILRCILSAYLQISAEEIIFRYNDYGKPLLDHSNGLCFNLAHSNNYAVFAIALESNIGIDLEAVRSDFDFVDIAKRFFSTSETESLLTLPSEDQVDAFFRCWTRKEAYIKAKGQGLSLSLQDFSVTLEDVEQSRIWTPSPEEDWHAFHFRPFPGYVAALAVIGKPRLNFLDFENSGQAKAAFRKI